MVGRLGLRYYWLVGDVSRKRRIINCFAACRVFTNPWRALIPFLVEFIVK